MKKTQLRNIIRESIKKLMTEQSSGNERICRVGGCGNGYGGTWKMLIDGGTPTPGMVFETPYSGIGSGTMTGVLVVRFCYPAGYTSPNSNSTHLRQFPSYSGPDCCEQTCWDLNATYPPSGLTGWYTANWFSEYGSGPSVYTPGPNGMNGDCSSNTGPNCISYGGSCDTSPSTACATQWFQNPNANWASNWINSKDCTNYTWPAQNLEQQALNIMAGAPNQNPAFMGGYSGYQDIWDAGNNSGLVSPQKQRFIAKMAKSMFAQCQLQNCC